MMFITNKYYACIGEYIQEERSDAQNANNAFLSAVASYSYSIYDSTSSRYRTYNYQDLVTPRFTVGNIYRCYINGMLTDDNHNVQTISEENKKNFMLIDLGIDETVRAFLDKLANQSAVPISLTIEPSRFVVLDNDAFARTHDKSTYAVWFTCRASFLWNTLYSMEVKYDNDSISEAVQNLWKKIRIRSKQCSVLNRALHLKIDTGDRMPKASYWTFNDRQWL